MSKYGYNIIIISFTTKWFPVNSIELSILSTYIHQTDQLFWFGTEIRCCWLYYWTNYIIHFSHTHKHTETYGKHSLFYNFCCFDHKSRTNSYMLISSGLWPKKKFVNIKYIKKIMFNSIIFGWEKQKTATVVQILDLWNSHNIYNDTKKKRKMAPLIMTHQFVWCW